MLHWIIQNIAQYFTPSRYPRWIPIQWPDTESASFSSRQYSQLHNATLSLSILFKVPIDCSTSDLNQTCKITLVILDYWLSTRLLPVPRHFSLKIQECNIVSMVLNIKGIPLALKLPFLNNIAPLFLVPLLLITHCQADSRNCKCLAEF